jgi:hypothetical protein
MAGKERGKLHWRPEQLLQDTNTVLHAHAAIHYNLRRTGNRKPATLFFLK